MKKEVSKTQKALNLWAIILIIWSVYRSKMRLPEWFDEFIAKPTIFVLPVFYYIKNIDKSDFFSALYIKPKQFLKDLSTGVIIGIVFFLSASLANYIKYKNLIFFQPLSFNFIVPVILTALATAISEEILSRGFVLKKLYEESKNIFTSSFFASILFFFLHVPILFTNIKITGNLLVLFMFTDILISLALSFMFLLRKSLTLPIIIHALYNVVVVLFV